jgi:hypothetical protein
MGGLFNTDKTMALLKKLNDFFQEAAFTANAKNTQLIADLTNMTSSAFAKSYKINLGDNTYDPKWYNWLDIFEKAGGNNVRKDMANALTYASSPDANERSLTDEGCGDGRGRRGGRHRDGGAGAGLEPRHDPAR